MKLTNKQILSLAAMYAVFDFDFHRADRLQDQSAVAWEDGKMIGFREALDLLGIKLDDVLEQARVLKNS